MLKGQTILLLVGLLAQFSPAGLAGNQAGLPKVMPVASWGASGADQNRAIDHASLRPQSNNNGRQIAIALPKSKKSESTDHKLSSAKPLSASAASGSRDIDEALDVVSVTAKKLAKEGGKRLGEYSRWFNALFRQQQAPPVITPAAGAYPRLRLSHAEPVTPKHPLWVLPDGRLKTVTVQ
jgi:hypothetical protein